MVSKSVEQALRIPNLSSPLNDRVFTALNGLDAEGHVRWVEVTSAGKEGSNQSLFSAAQKSGVSERVPGEGERSHRPGATMLFTDKPVDPTTQSHTGFQVLVAQKDKPPEPPNKLEAALAADKNQCYRLNQPKIRTTNRGHILLRQCL